MKAKIESTLDINQIKKELTIDAHALGIPSGSATIFIERTINDALKELDKHQIITKKDLDRIICKELKKYHPDFAYVYKNRDKII